MPIDRGPDEKWKIGRSNTAFLVASGIARSNSDARTKIDDGNVYINGKLVTDPNAIITWDTADPSTGAFLVEYGRKKKIWVKPT
jgi:tyrosyl-tRNA synthetase